MKMKERSGPDQNRIESELHLAAFNSQRNRNSWSDKLENRVSEEPDPIRASCCSLFSFFKKDVPNPNLRKYERNETEPKPALGTETLNGASFDSNKRLSQSKNRSMERNSRGPSSELTKRVSFSDMGSVSLEQQRRSKRVDILEEDSPIDPIRPSSASRSNSQISIPQGNNGLPNKHRNGDSQQARKTESIKLADLRHDDDPSYLMRTKNAGRDDALYLL